jgi:hypothetical protein
MRSWKTTALGICAIVSALAAAGKLILDGDPSTNPDYGTLIPLILAGVANIFAKDATVGGNGTVAP